MCGICGIIDIKGDPAKRDAVAAMCDELKHRGPDGEGIYLSPEGTACLGHRRLSIIDLSSCASQPMSNEDGSVWLVFNGEIYNFHELRPDLEDRGHRFKSHSDTETLVHLYEEYGERCVDHLRGMFAFAIWDDKKQMLFAARDRAGKKPFLYYYESGRFVFSSEFASLLKSGMVPKHVEPGAIGHYMNFGYIPAPDTIFKKVHKLPPAHILTVGKSGVKIERYWDLDYAGKIDISETEAASETLRLLREAVKMRLYSDVPLGAFLSGGIDSSCVVAVMSESTKVKTFTIGFDEEDYSELRYAKEISRRFGTDHHEFIVRPKALEVLELLVERYGEPYADSSCIPTYYVSRETRAFVTVALNGDGGDESFAGYERYQAMSAAEKMGKLGLRRAARALAFALPDSTDPKDIFRRARRFLSNAGLPAQERYFRWVGISGTLSLGSLYSPGFMEGINMESPLRLLHPYFAEEGGLSHLGLLDRLLKADVNTYLPNDLLVKVDIASMANSLEARSPFLDHKVMEFAASLPASYKIRGAEKKYILKKAFSGLLPGEILNRRKMGFGVPVGKWFRGELKDYMRETLLSQSCLSRGYFRPGSLKSLVEEHASGKRDFTSQLWALLNLELWHRKFMDGRA
ncbi:MAG: asparagine synthase (glutamine-hydrolyzing) [Candidatus Omnitrophota bacterium]